MGRFSYLLEEEKDDDIEMALQKTKRAMQALEKMMNKLESMDKDTNLPTWWTNKVAVAVEKIDSMSDYLTTND